jgi:hypothetical protein
MLEINLLATSQILRIGGLKTSSRTLESTRYFRFLWCFLALKRISSIQNCIFFDLGEPIKNANLMVDFSTCGWAGAIPAP